MQNFAIKIKMKHIYKKLFTYKCFCFLTLVIYNNLYALTNDTTEVTADIVGRVKAKCIIDNVTDLDFGEYTPFVDTNKEMTGVANVSIRCVNGLPYVAKLGTGNGIGATLEKRYMMRGNEKLAYSLYIDSGYKLIWGDGINGFNVKNGIGTGQEQILNIYGKVFSLQDSIQAGTYSDTVVISVDY